MIHPENPENEIEFKTIVYSQFIQLHLKQFNHKTRNKIPCYNLRDFDFLQKDL